MLITNLPVCALPAPGHLEIVFNHFLSLAWACSGKLALPGSNTVTQLHRLHTNSGPSIILLQAEEQRKASQQREANGGGFRGGRGRGGRRGRGGSRGRGGRGRSPRGGGRGRGQKRSSEGGVTQGAYKLVKTD